MVPQTAVPLQTRIMKTRNDPTDGSRSFQFPTVSPWLTIVCILGFVTASPHSARAQLVIDVDAPVTISPDAPSITLSLQNSFANSISISGLDFFIVVGAGTQGPTIDTSGNPATSVNLLTGPFFSSPQFSQFAGTLQPRSQQWGIITLSTPPSLAPGAPQQLATITFNSFPVGTYSLDFSGTVFHNQNGGDIQTMLPDVSVIVSAVPEPREWGLAFGLGLVIVLVVHRKRASLKQRSVALRG